MKTLLLFTILFSLSAPSFAQESKEGDCDETLAKASREEGKEQKKEEKKEEKKDDAKAVNQ
jgi:hypothetical protein